MVTELFETDRLMAVVHLVRPLFQETLSLYSGQLVLSSVVLIALYLALVERR